MNNSLLTALLLFGRWILDRQHGGSIANVLTALIAVVVPFRHLGVAERAIFYHTERLSHIMGR